MTCGVPIMRIAGVKKALEVINEKLYRSSQQKNSIEGFRYNKYMAYLYAFMTKVITDQEP